MARFFGANLDKKPHLKRTVLRWLQRLSDDFHVFVELEGSDFQVDFLVFKRFGIFDVEVKDWRVKEPNLENDWILADGARRENPFLQVLDQCDKVRDYILLQRNEIFSEPKSQAVYTYRNELKVFPNVAVPNPYASVTTFTHVFRRVFVKEEPLRQHLRRFEWFHGKPTKEISIEPAEIRRLAELFHLDEVDPEGLRPIARPKPAAPPATKAVSILRPTAAAVAAPEMPIRAPDPINNPYQFTYAVTGEQFYGRETELHMLKRALENVPPRHVLILGLQRSGKSSLAFEGIRRFTEGTNSYTKVEFDFRRLRGEGIKPDEDLTLEFLAALANERTGSPLDEVISLYRQKASKAEIGDQRRLFREALRQNNERKRRTILFLDECQEIADFLKQDRHRSFFSFIDSLCRDPELNLRVVIACRPCFLDLEPIAEINLGRLFETITLGPLDASAAESVVGRGSLLLKFSEQAKQRILFLTGRHAFWLQFFCHRIFENAIWSGKSDIGVDAVNSAFTQILRDPGCKPQFYLLYQEVETHPSAFELLKDVSDAAHAEGVAVQLCDLRRWLDSKRLRMALKPLVDNQILSVENVPQQPAVRFHVEALRAWMRPNLITL